MEPLTPAYYLARVEGELERHPRLKGKPVPALRGDEFAVWLERGGSEVARIEERGRHRWWRTGKMVDLRMVADELLQAMSRAEPVSEAEVVADIVRAITGI